MSDLNGPNPDVDQCSGDPECWKCLGLAALICVGGLTFIGYAIHLVLS